MSKFSSFEEDEKRFDGWRRYLLKEDLLSDHSYITGILGIEVPLNESYPYSSVLTEQILQEHLLVEGWFEDAKKYIKKKAEPLRDLVWILYKAIKENRPSFITSVTNSLKVRIIEPVQLKLEKTLNEFKLGDVYKWIETHVITPVYKITGIRSIINYAGVAILLRMGWKKIFEIGKLAKASANPLAALKEKVANWKETFFKATADKIKNVATGALNPIVALLAQIAGGAMEAADLLRPVTQVFATGGSKKQNT